LDFVTRLSRAFFAQPPAKNPVDPRASSKSVSLNTVSSGYTAAKVASRMIFAHDLRPKIIPPAPFSLSNPDDPAFNNSL
jgi:hypothetical protein